MMPNADSALITTLLEKAKHLEQQACSLQSDAQDLRLQAREIESRYEFQGPCIGCDHYQDCRLAGTCAAMDRCEKARKLAEATA